MTKVAIIGAGMTGVTAALALHRRGCHVQLFEKSKGASGRMSTRFAHSNASAFDHGAQYFTARSSEFRSQVRVWQQQGLVALWDARIVSLDSFDTQHNRAFHAGLSAVKKEPLERFVSVPAQHTLLRTLAADLPCHYSTTVLGLERAEQRWHVHSANGTFAGFDAVLVCLPAPQAADLLVGHQDAQQFALAAFMQPTWAVMAMTRHHRPMAFDAAFVNVGMLSWIANNASKPGRATDDALGAWVIHANSQFSREHLLDSPDQVQSLMLGEFESLLGDAMSVQSAEIHRWRYALGHLSDEPGCYWSELGLGVAGDWCSGGRVEGAFLSGRRMAKCVVDSFEDLATGGRN